MEAKWNENLSYCLLFLCIPSYEITPAKEDMRHCLLLFSSLLKTMKHGHSADSSITNWSSGDLIIKKNEDKRCWTKIDHHRGHTLSSESFTSFCWHLQFCCSSCLEGELDTGDSLVLAILTVTKLVQSGTPFWPKKPSMFWPLLTSVVSHSPSLNVHDTVFLYINISWIWNTSVHIFKPLWVNFPSLVLLADW